ncbi:DUF5906 domain-containing protein [Stenotrophomonas hibiscicola]|uniref:DUF5906 domain-containing protein n=1 Tax=Stenotrophomonas hibiscicola TaxID=86189 RepID=UPI001312C96A|nr:DUF5906 domain-containing protein [[Pseudomonas] hibiscicola]
MNLQNKNNIDFSDVNFFDEGDPLADECGPSSAVASALPVIQVEEPGQVALVEEEVAPVAEVVELSTEESSEEAKGEENSSKKRKPPSVPLRFANHLLSQRNGGAWGGRVEEGGTLIHKWNGSHYAYISDSDGMTMANKWLTEHAPDQATKKAEEQAWKFLESHLRWRCPIPASDPDRVVIPCRNSYIHMNDEGDISVRSPSPAFGLTHSLNIELGKPGQAYRPVPFKENSKFKAFINDAVSSAAMHDFLQEQCAMLLLPQNYQMAVWWWGEGGTGKSTLAELMCLYQSNPARPDLHALDKSFGKEVILGASLLVTSEVTSGKWCEETWKKIVAQDGISVERKNISTIKTYRNRAKWLICSNDAPFVVDKTNGVWRRMTILKWTNVVPEEQRKKDYYIEMFKEEGDAILCWILEGAQRLVKRGRFLPESQWPAEAIAMKEEVKTVSNNIKMWMKEEKVSKSEGFQDKAVIYQRYLDFCQLFQTIPVDTSIFWRSMSSYISGFEQKRVRMRVGGVNKPTYVANVKWCTKEEGEEIDLSSHNDFNEVPFGL